MEYPAERLLRPSIPSLMDLDCELRMMAVSRWGFRYSLQDWMDGYEGGYGMYSILIVDDESIILEGLSEVILASDLPFKEVKTAGSAKAALELFAGEDAI